MLLTAMACMLMQEAVGQGTMGRWQMCGLSGTTSGSVASTGVNANVTFSALSRGAGLTAQSATNGYNSSQFSTSNTLTISNNDYYEFTITPNPGYKISISAIKVRDQVSTVASSFDSYLRYSDDAYAGNVVASWQPGTAATNRTLNVSGVASLQNRATPVTFRIYGTDADAGGTTYRLDCEGTGAGQFRGVDIDGTVATIPYASQFISMSTGAATWCAGETRNVTVTVKNVGSSAWDDGVADFNVGCKWNADPDYLIRTDVQNLAPGATQTFTLSMTAPTTAGSNNLTFDIVKEGDCWFGTNVGSCGPGNSAYASPAITIEALPQISAFTGNTICSGAQGTLTITSTGTGPFSAVINGGNYSSITSGVAFNVSPTLANPTSTTNYTVTSITSAPGCVRTSGFTDNSATVTTTNISTSGETICQGGSSVTGLTSPASCADLTGQTSGPNNAGSGSEVAGPGTIAWDNEGNLNAAGSATAVLTSSATSEYLQGTSYGFGIPANATIQGFQVAINRSSSSNGGGNSINDVTLSLVKGGTIVTGVGSNKATTTDWPTSLGVANYGSSSDLWGTTWTAADVNATNFGIVLSAVNQSGFTSRTASVDYMQITVTYTLPGSIEWFTASSGGSSVQSGTPFFPVNDTEVIAAGGSFANLANTNTPGTYTFYAECNSNAGCRTATNFIIKTAPTASCSHTDVSCAGATDGTASVIAGAGNGSFTYLWTGGQTTATATGLAEGTYTVTVTSDGCTATCSTTIGNGDVTPPSITCPPTVSVNNDAGVCTGTVVALGTPTSNDNCGIASTVNDHPSSTYAGGNTTVTWTTTDTNGNTAQCTQTVTVVDTEIPTITCPADITLGTDDGHCYTEASFGTATTGDNCGVLSTTNNALSQLPTGVNSITWTVTDINGLTNSCAQAVTVVDDEPPSMLCPNHVTVNADAGQCFATNVNLGSLTYLGDNCSGIGTPTNNGLLSYPVGTTPVTWTVVDAAGNSSSCNHNVIVIDNQPPTISCPSATTYSCFAGIPAAAQDFLEFVDAGGSASDNCSIASVTHLTSQYITPPTTCANQFVFYREYMATDASGNTSSCQQNITIHDNVVPVITNCPANTTINCSDAMPSSAGLAFMDGCNPTTGTTPAAVVTDNGIACYTGRIVTYTWTATDECGNTAQCVQTISFNPDVTPPVLTPANANSNIGCNPSPAAIEAALGSATAMDNCSGNITVLMVQTTDPAVNTGGCNWSVTRHWNVADACSNMATPVSVTVSYSIVTAPVISGTPAGGFIGVNPNVLPGCGVATAINECGTVPVTCTPGMIMSTGCNRSQQFTYTATDVCSGLSATPVLVNYSWTEDVTPPVFDACPGNVVLNCGDALPPTTGLSFTDACSGPSITSTANVTDNNPSCINTRIVTYTWTAMDAYGNTAQCVQTITFNPDVTGPVFSNCPTNVVLNCGDLLPPVATPLAMDACSGPAFVSYNGQTQTFPAIGCPADVVYTRTWTATDMCGNTTLCSQTISFNPDVTPPTFLSCQSNLILNCGDPLPLTTGISFMDGCSGPGTTPPAMVNDNGAPCISNRVVIYTWTATDACGNTAQCTQTITFLPDNTGPVFATCPSNETLNCNDPVPPPANPLAMDACSGNATVVYNGQTDNGPQACLTNMIYTRTWTASDACGNTTLCSQTISYLPDGLPPTVVCPGTANVTCAADVPAPNTALVTVFDNCSGSPVVTFVGDVISNQTCDNRFTITRTYLATDACGNTASCEQTINVFDNVPPSISCPLAVNVSCASEVQAAATDYFAFVGQGGSASDNCPETITFIPVSDVVITHVGDVISAQTCANRYTITRTYLATDICGNTNSCTQTITVNDQTAPDITTCPAGQNAVADGNCQATVPDFTVGVVATDNCGGFTVSQSPAAASTVNTGNHTITLTVTDACGNTATCTTTFNVTDNGNPTIICSSSVTVTANNAGCTATGISLVLPVINDNCPGVGVPTNNAPVNYPVGTTTVIWTVMDASGNTAACNQMVTVVNPVLVSVAITENSGESPDEGFLCEGDLATLTANASGSSGYNYSWSPGGAVTSTISTGLQGIYTVVVTDANGCTNSATTSITVTPIPVVSFTGLPAVICYASPAINLTPNINGGVFSGNGIVGYQFVPNIAGPGTHTISYTYTDPSGCTGNTSSNVTVATTFAIVSSATAGGLISPLGITNVTCDGSQTYMIIGNIGYAIADVLVDGISVGPLGSYTFNNVMNNHTIHAIFVSVCPNPATANAGSNAAICSNLTYTLGGSIGGGASSATWSTSGTGSFTPTDTFGVATAYVPSPADITAGSVVITLTTDDPDGAGSCVAATASFTLTIHPATAVNLSATALLCNGASNGTATAMASGGTGAYSYLWNTLAVTSAISGLPANVYTVTVSDINSCSASASVTIAEQSAIVPAMSATAVTCFGTNTGSAGVAVSGGTPGYTYMWNTGSVSTSISNLFAGYYTVTATDANGCTASASVQVSQAANNFVVSISKTNVRCYGKATGSATALATGGGAPYMYQWSNGSSGTALTGLTAGTYTVTVTDNYGCTKTKTVVISQNVQWTVIVIPTGNPGEANAMISGGIGLSPFTYSWNTSPVQTNATSTGLTGSGVYKVKVTDAKGCTHTATIQGPVAKMGANTVANMQVNVFPNPTDGILNISVENAAQSNCNFRLTDATGRLIFNKDMSLEHNTAQIDLGNVAPGIYNLTVINAGQLKTVRIVIER